MADKGISNEQALKLVELMTKNTARIGVPKLVKK